ncbi:MAG: hypothetical protein AAF235_08790, partial [Planctomycetota bacterium]
RWTRDTLRRSSGLMRNCASDAQLAASVIDAIATLDDARFSGDPTGDHSRPDTEAPAPGITAARALLAIAAETRKRSAAP